MKRLSATLTLLLFACFIAQAQTTRDVADIVVTSQPSDGDTLVVNGDTRTWKSTVSTPSSQIAIGGTIADSGDNLYTHVVSSPFSSTQTSQITDGVKLRGAVDLTLTVSQTGGWGSITVNTTTLDRLLVVQVPFDNVPDVGSRKYIADQLVKGINDWADTNNLSSTVLPQLIASSRLKLDFGDAANPTIRSGSDDGLYQVSEGIIGIGLDGAQIGQMGSTNWVIRGTGTVRPGLRNVKSEVPTLTGGVPNIVPNDQDINTGVAWKTNDVVAMIAGGTAQLQVESGKVIIRDALEMVNSPISIASGGTGGNSASAARTSLGLGSLATQAASAVAITGGVIDNVDVTGLTATNSPIESYGNDKTSNFQAGPGASATSQGSVAIGQNSNVSQFRSVAIGAGTTDNGKIRATALGPDAQPTADNQVRLGTSSEHTSMAGNGHVADNFAVGSDKYSFPSSLGNGLAILTGAAPTVDPTGGVVHWYGVNGWSYRSSNADEGGGRSNLAHNRGEQQLGSGTDYDMTGTYARVDFGGDDPEITLPTAGRYMVHAIVSVVDDTGGDTQIDLKLHNSTDISDVADSERSGHTNSANAINQIVLRIPITVTGAKEIEIWGKASTTTADVRSQDTTIDYIRLN